MRRFIYTLTGICLVLSMAAMAAESADSADVHWDDFRSMAIYGDDNRREPFEATQQEALKARSVAGRFSKDHLIDQGSSYKVQRNTLGKEKCDKIRFAEQTLGPSCSGFLVKPNILVTAGHCMTKESTCTDSVWVFDYALKSAGDQSYKSISKSKVYSCQKIIAQKFAQFGDIDYAIIQLDRPVLDRNPLELDFESQPPLQTSIYAVGYPSGLPLKVTSGAQILKNESLFAFDSDLDIFQGNSGSPVLDSLSGKVLGITSHGHDDYVRDGGSITCKIPRVCLPNENCHLSTASRVSNFMEEFRQLKED